MTNVIEDIRKSVLFECDNRHSEILDKAFKSNIFEKCPFCNYPQNKKWFFNCLYNYVKYKLKLRKLSNTDGIVRISIACYVGYWRNRLEDCKPCSLCDKKYNPYGKSRN